MCWNILWVRSCWWRTVQRSVLLSIWSNRVLIFFFFLMCHHTDGGSEVTQLCICRRFPLQSRRCVNEQSDLAVTPSSSSCTSFSGSCRLGSESCCGADRELSLADLWAADLRRCRNSWGRGCIRPPPPPTICMLLASLTCRSDFILQSVNQ